MHQRLSMGRRNHEMRQAYLTAPVESGDSAAIAAVLGDITRVRNFSQPARDAAMNRG